MKDVVDVPLEWEYIMFSARHSHSPFKVVKPVEHLHDLQASVRQHFLPNPKPRLLTKPLRKYRVKDTQLCLILVKTPYHDPWNSHPVTERQEASELTLAPRQPAKKTKTLKCA
jgi:hypothetical protein